MNRISPTIAAIVVGVLALLLILYVMAGGDDGPKNPEKLSDDEVAGLTEAGPEARCAAQRTYDLIRAELFRRAAAVRGEDTGAFSNVASYSVVRMASPRLASHDEDTGKITCAGTLTLDLPPGLRVADGRTSLTADVAYAIEGRGTGGDQLTLSNADGVIAPLATLARQGAAPAEPPPNEDDEGQPARMSEDRNEPAAVPPQAPPPPAPRAAPRPAPPKVTPPAVKPAPSPPPPRATASPSFNCRNARTRGEIAVCNDGGLAGLDRQMASQFNRAMSAADPSQRTLLQRTRGSFLRFRDSCRSDACVAGAYRDRMREISDIMAGRWNP